MTVDSGFRRSEDSCQPRRGTGQSGVYLTAWRTSSAETMKMTSSPTFVA